MRNLVWRGSSGVFLVMVEVGKILKYIEAVDFNLFDILMIFKIEMRLRNIIVYNPKEYEITY